MEDAKKKILIKTPEQVDFDEHEKKMPKIQDTTPNIEIQDLRTKKEKTMAEVAKTKRQGGQIKDGKWLVLTESKGEAGKGYVHNCGTEILGKKVAHPVWDGPFPLSGTGQVKYETVPYCPKCEEEPALNGAPITPKGSYHNP